MQQLSQQSWTQPKRAALVLEKLESGITGEISQSDFVSVLQKIGCSPSETDLILGRLRSTGGETCHEDFLARVFTVDKAEIQDAYVEQIMVRVLGISGNLAWGPQAVAATSSVQSLRLNVASALDGSVNGLKLLHNGEQLKPQNSILESGLPNPVELSLVISRSLKKTNVKVVLLGDAAVGKTSLLTRYSTGSFPAEYIPSVCDISYNSLEYEDQAVTLQLVDTGGQEDYDRVRPLSYSDTDVFLVLFSLTSRASLRRTEETWKPEAHEHCPGVPIVLVGTKSDLQEQLHEAFHITQEEALQTAQRIGAAQYLECSALKGLGVDEAFQSAVWHGAKVD